MPADPVGADHRSHRAGARRTRSRRRHGDVLTAGAEHTAVAVSPSDAGLQAERTGLAWSRTSLAVAANGALLAVRELRHDPTVLGWVPAVLAAVIAAAVAVYGRRRTRRLATAPLPVPLAPRRAVLLLGGAVVVLALVSAAPLLR